MRHCLCWWLVHGRDCVCRRERERERNVGGWVGGGGGVVVCGCVRKLCGERESEKIACVRGIVWGDVPTSTTCVVCIESD